MGNLEPHSWQNLDRRGPGVAARRCSEPSELLVLSSAESRGCHVPLWREDAREEERFSVKNGFLLVVYFKQFSDESVLISGTYTTRGLGS